jgi:hypothetical protein
MRAMITLATLKRAVEQRTRSSGPDFDFVFYLAVNSLIDAVNRDSMLDVDRIDIDDPPTTIGLEDKYFTFALDGVRHFMAKFAMWAKESDQQSEADFARSLALLVSDAINDEAPASNMNYDDDDDDLDEE